MLPVPETLAEEPISGRQPSRLMRASSLCSGPAFISRSIVPFFDERRSAPNSTVRSQSWSARNGATTDSGRSWSSVRHFTRLRSRSPTSKTSVKMSQLPITPLGLVCGRFLSA